MVGAAVGGSVGEGVGRRVPSIVVGRGDGDADGSGDGPGVGRGVGARLGDPDLSGCVGSSVGVPSSPLHLPPKPKLILLKVTSAEASAQRLRGGRPPLSIVSDGTVF